MPEFLEKKLEGQYGEGNPRVYATMNALGAMKGSKETPKGRAMQSKHDADSKSARASKVKKALQANKRG